MIQYKVSLTAEERHPLHDLDCGDVLVRQRAILDGLPLPDGKVKKGSSFRDTKAISSQAVTDSLETGPWPKICQHDQQFSDKQVSLTCSIDQAPRFLAQAA